MTQWHDDENAMERWWKHDDTNLKQRLYDVETAMARWWKRDSTMVKMRWYDDETAMALCWKRDIIFYIVSSHHSYMSIVPSLFHHHAVVFSSSYLCARNHHCTIVHIGFRETKMLRITVIGRFLNDTISRLVSHLAWISRLASNIVRRRERGNIPLNSIPFIFYIKQILISF
jgi:hypothetical protein